MSLRDKYKQLEPECRRQIKALLKYFDKDPKILASARSLKPRDEKERRYALALAIKNMPLLALLENKHIYKSLYCYNTKEGSPHGKFHFIDQITSGDHVCLISGYIAYGDTKVPAVCKYYKGSKRTIDYEINCYKRLAETGCEIPWMSSSYRLLGERVMIVERLHTIDTTDKPAALGIDVLKQLQYLHTFGVHCDLKPGNIMVRRSGYECYVADPEKCLKYMIIDHGGTAIERFGKGFKRFIWNPKFTSQLKGEKDQVTGPYYDFLELGYTMTWLDADRRKVNMKKFNHRTTHRGKFKQYMNELDKYKDDPFTLPDDIYARLINILS